jgi:hypothetical protein
VLLQVHWLRDSSVEDPVQWKLSGGVLTRTKVPG